jgi:protein involved in polysaccharide export with SLBB domain
VSFRGQRYLVACVAGVLFFHRPSCVSAQDISPVGTNQQAQQTIVGTADQTNERIRSLGTTAAQTFSPHEYTIGVGDLLSVSVFDVPDLTREVRVSQAGTISLPLVPTRLHVQGLTESQAEQMIADVLQANGLVSHPEVGVMVKEHKSRPITVVGAVQRPMVYQADHAVTLLEVLAEAGGISNDAGDTIIVSRAHSPSFVMIPNPEPISSEAPGAASTNSSNSEAPEINATAKTDPDSPAFASATEMAQTPAAPSGTASNSPGTVSSPSGNIITVNLNELLETGDTRNNLTLQAGDVVTVPHAGIVYVLGAVTRPGGYVLSNDRSQLTTMKVLALAGGLTKIAKTSHAVIIRKDSQGKQTETEVDLGKVINQKAEDLQMRASDILYIPDNHTKEALLQALQVSIAVATAVAIYRIGYQ